MLLPWVVVFSQPNMMAVGLDGCCLSTVPKDSSSMAAWVLFQALEAARTGLPLSTPSCRTSLSGRGRYR